MKKNRLLQAVSGVLAILMVLPILASCKKPADSTTATTTVSTPKKDPADSLYQGEQILLLDEDTAPVIYVDAADHKQTVRAVGDLQKDFERVTGKKPSLVSSPEALSGAEIAVKGYEIACLQALCDLFGNLLRLRR